MALPDLRVADQQLKAVIACGSRDWTDAAMLRGTLAAIHAELAEDDWMLLIEGRAPGADRMAGKWADEMLRERVGHAKFAADWTRYGKAAGPLRNRAMLAHLLAFRDEHHADIEVVAFSDSTSNPKSGTRDMMKIAKAAGVRITLYSHERAEMSPPETPCADCGQALGGEPFLTSHEDRLDRHIACATL